MVVGDCENNFRGGSGRHRSAAAEGKRGGKRAGGLFPDGRGERGGKIFCVLTSFNRFHWHMFLA